MKEEISNLFKFSDVATILENLPQNRPLVKDSGLWTIYDESCENPICQQMAIETFKGFLYRYACECLSNEEQIDLIAALCYKLW